MGNCVCKQTDEDEAADALLDGFDPQSSRPRGPPPPYQVEAPFYAMSEEQRVQLVQRVTMIQSLPLGRYDVGEEEKDKSELKLEPSEEVQGREKKGEKDRECPICMMDFAVGEPIRLLPCMHFYHMRCIDDWLMRSYSCPTCMERVDVGMHHTLSSTAVSAQSGVRRRRRRRERGSSSSITSGISVGSVGGAEGGAKRREENGRQFVPDYVHQARRQVVFPPSGHHITPSGHNISPLGHDITPSGQDIQVSGQIVLAHGEHLPGQAAEACAMDSSVPQSVGNMSYLTDLSLSRTSSAQSTGLQGSASMGASVGAHDHEVQLLNDSGFASRAHPTSQEELAYSMDQITFSDYPRSRCSGYLAPSSPTRSPNVGVAPSPPMSPPVFEYHFEYPTSPQHNS